MRDANRNGNSTKKGRTVLQTLLLITLPAVIISSSVTYWLTKRAATKRIAFSISLKPGARGAHQGAQGAMSANGTLGKRGVASDSGLLLYGGGAHDFSEGEFIARDEDRDLPKYQAFKPLIVGSEALKPMTDPGDPCEAVEMGGGGASRISIGKRDWKVVIERFHEAKKRLLKWLSDHRRQFPSQLAHQMEARVRDLKIIKPPTTEELDLNWRGIGVFGRDDSKGLVVRLGPGLVQLIVANPQRGLFEVTRLVAQAWAPCELKTLGFEGVWDPLMKCLGIPEQDTCANLTYSDGGWAMSTTLGVALAPPGCKIPGLAEESQAKCIQQIPLPLTMQEQKVSESVWRQQ